MSYLSFSEDVITKQAMGSVGQLLPRRTPPNPVLTNSETDRYNIHVT